MSLSWFIIEFNIDKIFKDGKLFK